MTYLAAKARLVNGRRYAAGQVVDVAGLSLADLERLVLAGVLAETAAPDAGPPGPQGTEGEQGPQGVQGPEGPQGEQGIDGPQGLPGLEGEQGATGLQGVVGPQGADGPEGPQGVQGPIGPIGPATFTPKGPWNNVDAFDQGDVVTWGGSSYYALSARLAGVDPPTGTASSPGADTATNAGWAFLALEGAQGVQGIAGPQGVAGSPGAAGEQGPRGFTGLTGEQGPIGPAGGQGPQGIQGIAGPQGIQGLPGLPGADGLPGAPGGLGPIGPPGPGSSEQDYSAATAHTPAGRLVGTTYTAGAKRRTVQAAFRYQAGPTASTVRLTWHAEQAGSALITQQEFGYTESASPRTSAVTFVVDPGGTYGVAKETTGAGALVNLVSWVETDS